MTSITRNLPPFIRDLGVSIIGEKCYRSLIEDLNVQDVQCIRYALSKGLGIGIVVGGSVMKVPQIMLIISARSAAGLSLPAYILETLSYAITLAYSMRSAFPFSTYGENLFLALQNAAITLLIVAFSPKTPSKPNTSNAPQLALTALFLLLTPITLLVLPSPTLALLQLATLPLSLFSKIPQILSNAKAQSTGQLSAVAVFAQIAGCLARLFTTATEVGDRVVMVGFMLALGLNLVLGVQMARYWGKEGVRVEEKKEKVPVPVAVVEKREQKEEAKPTAYEPPTGQQQAVHRVSTPPPRASTPSGSVGRKWARKVD